MAHNKKRYYKLRSEMTSEEVDVARLKDKEDRRLNGDKRRAYEREWSQRPENKVKKAVRDKTRREANPELFRERRKKSREKDGDVQRARVRAWCAANKERRKEYRRRHDTENREQVRAMKRRWNDANRDRINVQQRARRKKNREHYLQQFRDWMKNHQEHFAELKRGKAPRRAAILQKWQLCDELCYICGLHLDRTDIEMDHVLPRAHEGTNDIENLMPTHRKCNRRKNKRLDYPIARFDLVEKATVIKSAPRTIRRSKLEEAA